MLIVFFTTFSFSGYSQIQGCCAGPGWDLKTTINFFLSEASKGWLEVYGEKKTFTTLKSLVEALDQKKATQTVKETIKDNSKKECPEEVAECPHREAKKSLLTTFGKNALNHILREGDVVAPVKNRLELISYLEHAEKAEDPNEIITDLTVLSANDNQ
jgi:hypothetical protein